jgi:hypothetical protein
MRDTRAALAAAAVIGVLGIVFAAPSSHPNSFAQLPDLGVGLTNAPDSDVQIGIQAATHSPKPATHARHAMAPVVAQVVPAAAPIHTHVSTKHLAMPTTTNQAASKGHTTSKITKPNVNPDAPSTPTTTQSVGAEATTTVSKLVKQVHSARTATVTTTSTPTTDEGKHADKHADKHTAKRADEHADKHPAKRATKD